MKLSESLRRNIMEVRTGGILNKFKVKKRRDVLFFESVLAEYIKACEDAGYNKEIMEIGMEWMRLMREIVPGVFRKAPLFFMNNILKHVWVNIGLLDHLRMSREGDLIMVRTRNESITRLIGKNSFLPGLYMGISNVLFNSELDVVETMQAGGINNYTFKIRNVVPVFSAGRKAADNKLDYFPAEQGFTLKNAIQNRVFQLKGNRIYFRGTFLCPMESTLFHLIGNRKIMLEKFTVLSHGYFSKIAEKNAPAEKRMVLLKTLLQTMGWGNIKIIMRNRKDITLKIINPPTGVQQEKDNWEVFARVILGYVRLLNKSFRISDMSYSHKKLEITYHAGGNA
jgi:hypothetical protein